MTQPPHPFNHQDNVRTPIFCRLIVITILLWSCFTPQKSLAQPQEIHPEQAEGRLIANVTILGLRRTHKLVVLNEIQLAEGRRSTSIALQDSLRRLKNLRIFSRVEATLYLDEAGHIIVNLLVDESWTTIPILKLTKGGGTTYLVAGLYDVNTNGRLLETGAQLESWDKELGGVIWFRNPRLWGRDLRLGADLWSVKRPRHLYHPDGVSQGTYILESRKLNFFFDRDFSETLTIGSGLELRLERFLGIEMAEVDPAIREQVSQSQVMRTSLAKLRLKLGNMNYERQLSEGAVSELHVGYVSTDLNSDQTFYNADWDTRAFWRLGHSANVGVKLRLASTNSNSLQNLYYVGGFENIRGYLDGQLRGRRFWQTNLEYRDTFYQTAWFYLQGNLFADALQLINPHSDIESQSDDIFTSVGAGLRLGSNKVYRFIMRLDLAIGTSHPATSRVSFGVQQFF